MQPARFECEETDCREEDGKPLVFDREQGLRVHISRKYYLRYWSNKKRESQVETIQHWQPTARLTRQATAGRFGSKQTRKWTLRCNEKKCRYTNSASRTWNGATVSGTREREREREGIGVWIGARGTIGTSLIELFERFDLSKARIPGLAERMLSSSIRMVHHHTYASWIRRFSKSICYLVFALCSSLFVFDSC